jgi:hypothetical protein
MTGATPALPTQLVGDEILLRALRTKAEQEDKRRAFLLRNNERDTGLSVRYNCTPDDCENELKKSYGVLSLTAGQVTGLGLPVVPDSSTHANITGVPHEEDDADRAMSIAGQLCALALAIREGLRYRPT